jgi:hypothetical protein
MSCRKSSRSGVVFCSKQAQFSFRHSKLRNATPQANCNPGKYEDRRLIRTVEMDGHLRCELAQIL